MVVNDPDNPVNDAPLAIGLTAIIGSLWWYTLFFVYVPNTNYITSAANAATEPIAWFWTNLMDGSHGWTAASYLSTFILYLITSVIEVIGYILYQVQHESGACFFRTFASTVGYWLGLYAGMLPWVFSLLQLAMATEAGGLGGNLGNEFGHNALFLTIGGGVMWIFHTLMHIIYVPLLRDALYCEGDEDGENK